VVTHTGCGVYTESSVQTNPNRLRSLLSWALRQLGEHRIDSLTKFFRSRWFGRLVVLLVPLVCTDKACPNVPVNASFSRFGVWKPLIKGDMNFRQMGGPYVADGGRFIFYPIAKLLKATAQVGDSGAPSHYLRVSVGNSTSEPDAQQPATGPYDRAKDRGGEGVTKDLQPCTCAIGGPDDWINNRWTRDPFIASAIGLLIFFLGAPIAFWLGTNSNDIRYRVCYAIDGWKLRRQIARMKAERDKQEMAERSHRNDI